MAEEKAHKKRIPPKSRETMRRWYQLVWHLVWPIFTLIMYPVKVFHRERVPEGACLICANHSSNADPPMICLAAGHKHFIRIMAKQELMDIPVIGWVFNKIGTFGVDRGNSDLNAIKTAMKVLKGGDKLLMFPEGTRVAEGQSGSAHTGAVMLAMKTGVPVVPVFSTRTKRLFHRSRLVFGEPYVIKPAGKRATPQEYEEQAQLLLEKIYGLEAEIS